MRKAIIDVFNMSWPTIVIVICILAIMRTTMLFKGEKKKTSLYEEIFNLLFIIYLLVLFRLVTSQDLQSGGTNLKPFEEILRYSFGTTEFYKQVYGNILLFIPLGYFFTRYCRIKKLGGIILSTLLASLSIEVVQHFIGRCFDIDDVILNVTGGIIGFLIFKLLKYIRSKLPNFLRKEWFYNLLTIILVLVGILIIIKVI